QQARLAVRKGFEKDYTAAKAARTRRELAKTLFDRAQEGKDPLPLRLGFWMEAQDVAADNFDANLACKAIDEMAKYFDVDALSERTKVLEGIAKELTPSTTIGELQNFAEATCVTLDEVIAAERFDLAKRLAVIVKALSHHKRFFERRAYFTNRVAEVDFGS